MNRIKKLFKEKGDKILSIYYTAGYPTLQDTLLLAKALEQQGVDMLEIGIPYSDPVADGAVIQASSKAALDNGMTLDLLFNQLRALRKEVAIPILLMGYYNVVLQYGVERFCKACVEVGVDGCILPDLPLVEYERRYKQLFEKNGVCNIFLVTPQTSEERIRKIDDISDGFIYLLSASATTGRTASFSPQTISYFKRIAGMKLKNPTMIGFGIYNQETINTAFTYANGAIIGSAFVKNLEGEQPIAAGLDFVKTLRADSP